MTQRRAFLKTIAAGGTLALTGIGLSDRLRVKLARAAPNLSGPVPLAHAFSVEAVLNSRQSYHSVGDDAVPEEVLANVLWAAGKAPMVGATRRIFVATFEGVFEYDAASHSVSLHLEGNQMSEPDIAFELAVAGDSALDAGAALHYAHLAATAFWTSASDQVACCTKESAAQNARSTWDIDDEVQMVNCFGRLSAVAGIQAELAATPSDDSLPAPSTDGGVPFETALGALRSKPEFADTAPSAATLGQILWAAYGCTPHRAPPGPSSSPVGLTVGSAAARYYLTDRVYLVAADGLFRYHNRLPGSDLVTQDHRLERLGTDDLRAALAGAEPSLPGGAPAYLVFASWEASNWSEVEAGFAGASALLQASSLGLAGHLAAVGDAADVRSSLSLPADDVPLLVMAVGYEATSGAGGAGGAGGATATTGGESATGGASTTGGASATGGATATTGGDSATGGADPTGSGGSATGGADPTASGASATGGASGSGGLPSSAGGARAPGASSDGSDDPGCGCRAASRSSASRSAAVTGLLALIGFVIARRSGKRDGEA